MRRAGAAGSRAKAGLVLVHGRGATAAGMIDFAAALGVPEVALIAPEAAKNSWWPTSFLAPMADLASWLDVGLAAVGDAVGALEADGLSRRSISICGFSQGACLALEFAARHGAGLGSVFGFSGALLGTADAPGDPRDDLYGHLPKRFDYATRLEGVMIDMSCHARDPHIPLARFEESAAFLRGLGADVTGRIHPGAGHAILESDVAALRAVLNRVWSDDPQPRPDP